MKTTATETAHAAIRQTGARVTNARIQVLALLLRTERALTHLQIEGALRRAHDIDRVTIYRVLEWLIANNLARKVAVGDRSWRFDAVHPGEHRHAHFQCGECGTVTCLEKVRQPTKVNLPAGFLSREVELTVKGICAACASRLRKSRKGASLLRAA